MGKNPECGGDYPTGKQGLSTQGCPREWETPPRNFLKNILTQPMSGLNWNLLLPSFFLPHLELENALKRSSSFGNNRKRSIYIYKYEYILKNGNYELQGGQIYFYSVIVSVCHLGS